MANNRDINADLGNQTIEGTEPPIALEAEIVMPDGSSQPIPTAAELDAQLEALMAEPDSTIVTDPIEGDISSINTEADDLDAQLEALMAESVEPDDSPIIMTPPEDPDPIITDPIDTEASDLDAQLEAMMAEPPEDVVSEPIEPTDSTEPAESAESAEPSHIDEINAQIDAILSTPEPQQTPDEEPVVLANSIEPEPEPIAEQPAPAHNSAATEEARAMLEQAKLLMEQAQQAQQAAQLAAKTAQAQAQQAQIRPQPTQTAGPVVQPTVSYGDPATQAMMQQAQMMLQQAQQAQLQAQQAAQSAQMQAQVVQATARPAATPYAIAPDPYATKEVDRLKNELDSMRELVNKLTFTLAQTPGGAQQIQQAPHYYNDTDREQYRKIESELERMRRDIMEKDLRDREKELDRRQKEAENNVKDIRPEMVQMSDSRDLAPMGGQPSVGGEYIPLANGVYYSIKDKQVYVMTPASNAATAKPTIEQPRSAPQKVRRAAAPAKRRPALHRRPGSPSGRRPAPGRRRPPHR